MRVYEFAKEFGKNSKDFIHELKSEFGFEIKSHLSVISEEQMEQVKTKWNQKLLSSLTDLRDDLEKQVDDSHKQALKEVFNVDKKEPEFISYDLMKDNEESKKTEEPEKTGEWTLGSGDTITPEVKLDKKAIKELKKENEKAVKNSMESAEKARKEYKKAVHNITENPDTWATPSVKNDQEIIIEKPSWFSRIFGWWLNN